MLDRGTPAGLKWGMAQVSRTVPERMRAIAIDRFGGPEVLTMHTLPVPVPGASEVLIAVHTAEVGQWDADMRSGWSLSGKKPRSARSEEHTSELQSLRHLVCRLLLEKKKTRSARLASCDHGGVAL